MSSPTRSTLAFMILLLLPGMPDARAEIKTGISASFGFGMVLDVKGEARDIPLDAGGKLDTSMGFNLFTHFELLEFLDVGGEARLLWWRMKGAGDGEIDRSMMIEVGPSLGVRFEAVPDLDLFFRLTSGFTIVLPSKEQSALFFPGGDQSIGEWKTGLGLYFGGFLGTSYNILDMFGILAEIGFLYHQAYGDWDIQEVDPDLKGEYTLSCFQFHLNCGIYF